MLVYYSNLCVVHLFVSIKMMMMMMMMMMMICRGPDRLSDSDTLTVV